MNAKQIRRFDQEVRLAWEFRMQLPYEARTAYDRVPEEEWPSGGPLAVVAYRLQQVDEEFEMNPPLDRDAHTTVLHVLHRVQTARGLHEMRKMQTGEAHNER